MTAGVHLLFLDESGKPGDKAFALGGVALRADRWHELRDLWEAAQSECGWSVYPASSLGRYLRILTPSSYLSP